MIHLRYKMQSRSAPPSHPQTAMKLLGITYRKGVPQSIADQWWFLDCENVPDSLPDYLSEFGDTFDPSGFPECK